MNLEKNRNEKVNNSPIIHVDKIKRNFFTGIDKKSGIDKWSEWYYSILVGCARIASRRITANKTYQNIKTSQTKSSKTHTFGLEHRYFCLYLCVVTFNAECCLMSIAIATRYNCLCLKIGAFTLAIHDIPHATMKHLQ